MIRSIKYIFSAIGLFLVIYVWGNSGFDNRPGGPQTDRAARVWYFLIEDAKAVFSNPSSFPIPNNEGLIDWVVGSVITTEKGAFFDDHWKIEKGEISDFKVIKVTENPANKIYSATISFRATSNGHGIQVAEAMIRYNVGTEPNKLHFIEFLPIIMSKIGN